jgi:hypothetical protein
VDSYVLIVECFKKMIEVFLLSVSNSASAFRQPKIFITTMRKGSRMAIYVMLGNLKSAAFEKFAGIEDRDKKASKAHGIARGKIYCPVLLVRPVRLCGDI